MQFTDYDIECIEKAKSIIDADISRHYTIEFISGKTGIGKTKLKKGFKQYYGISPFTYLRKQRMIKSGKLLLETNKTIKQIAKVVGFGYATNFTTAFTFYYGITPNEYRNYFSSK